MRRKILIVSVLLLLGLGYLSAQSRAIVEYYESVSGEMRAIVGEDEYYLDDFSFGEELPVGFTLITEDGDYVEIKLDPNGSIFRISENTNFRIDALQGQNGATENTFSVAFGKLRAIMARDGSSRYSIKSATAVAGIRGTDVTWLSGVGKSILYVADGLADFTNAAGDTIEVGAGMMADALADVFQALPPTADLLDELTKNMDFNTLSKDAVPGYVAAVEEVAEILEEAGVTEEEVLAEAKATFIDKIMKLLGFEIGSVTIGGETYAKAIIQPKFAFGKFKAALYLPIIYKTDMFDPSDWYHPVGANGEENDEWSFGYDKYVNDEGALAIIRDALDDLFLKIRYIEIGEQRDPFFIKFGNLHNITIGHGMIMRNYANDADFPTERKVGLNLGLDLKKLGFEAMVNDAADPEIFGTRFYLKPAAPAFPMAIGISAIADINPEGLAGDETAVNGNPIFINAGADIDLPFIHTDALSIIMFSDFALMLPYFREAVGSIPEGFVSDAILYDGSLKNWGVAAGFMGNILMVDYRLEWRFFDGTFSPAFYSILYDRKRSGYVADLVEYLNNQDDPAYDVQYMGVYGEAGFTIDKLFYVEAGYFWPWPIGAAPALWPVDTLHVEFGLFRDALPLYGSIAMDRIGIVSNVKDGVSWSFFDENLYFSGELVYPISTVLDLALAVTTNVTENDDGTKKVSPSVSILTRFTP